MAEEGQEHCIAVQHHM